LLVVSARWLSFFFVAGRSCLLRGITRRVKSSYTVHHRVKQSALTFDIFSLNLTFGSQNVKLISIFDRIL
jgi:hypothetical protein